MNSKALGGGTSYQSQPNIFMDNYARSQMSPLKDKTYQQTGMITSGGAGVSMTMSSEVDRLIRERDDLIRSGCYT